MYSIILVDDEPSVLKGLSELIDWPAYDLMIAACVTSAAEALSLMRDVPVQILITDICMPDMDGLALISKAKALNESLRCIVISAHNEFDYVRQALKLGVENYLLKPINANELVETLLKTIHNIDQLSFKSHLSVETMVFRNNIFDRWVNNLIENFELSERAELLQIDLGAKEYQALVLTPIASSTIEEKLSKVVAAMDIYKKCLVDSGFSSYLFIDRHANLVIILRGSDLEQRRELFNEALKSAYALSGEALFMIAGYIVSSAYKISISYKCAYALIPIRFLKPDLLFARCDDYGIRASLASIDLLKFEQALEEYNDSEAISIMKKQLSSHARQSHDSTVSLIIPYLLKMLSLLFDDIVDNHKTGEIPKQLQRILSSGCNTEMLNCIADTVKTVVQMLKSRQSELNPIIRRAIGIIHDSYDKGVNLNVITDQLNMNPTYFGNLFKKETGQLFTDYITNYRLSKAKYLLAGTDCKIGEISEAVGISRQSYFNRLFKEKYGITPAEYRRDILSQR